MDAQAPEHIKLYTDGSVENDKVGAAAILTRNRKTINTAHYHLSSSKEHTVFGAELVGILLRLQLIKGHPKGNLSYVIGVDNQAAIKALTSGLNKSGHYIMAEALNAVEGLKKTMGKKYTLTIRWMAGHSNIPGNKKVNAKCYEQTCLSFSYCINSLPLSLSGVSHTVLVMLTDS